MSHTENSCASTFSSLCLPLSSVWVCLALLLLALVSSLAAHYHLPTVFNSNSSLIACCSFSIAVKLRLPFDVTLLQLCEAVLTCRALLRARWLPDMLVWRLLHLMKHTCKNQEKNCQLETILKNSTCFGPSENWPVQTCKRTILHSKLWILRLTLTRVFTWLFLLKNGELFQCALPVSSC